jgi:uncharacterized protein (TIGR01319 family)
MVDFGSTYTKVTALDLESETLLGRAQSPTTIENDVNIGLNKALDILKASCDFKDKDIRGRCACSSAAGGLKMAAIGLVPALTLKAAQRAALGAGAKVLSAHGFEIDNEIVKEIEDIACDIILLSGGTDGGNKKTILHNAGMIAESDINCPILVCGNRSASEEVKAILEGAGKRVYVTKNVLPNIETVEVEPAQKLIRRVFIEHIVKAKGLDKARELFDRDIIPTPSASLMAAELLSDGTESEAGIGSLMVVEVGGATTNIHSVADVKPASQQTVMRGLPESRVTRTVEGDLGLRFNARSIFEYMGNDKLKDIVLSMDPVLERDKVEPEAYARYLHEHTDHVPENAIEALLDCALARSAVDIAVERHSGMLKQEFSVMGEINIQYGKNYMEVENILGVGGVFKYGAGPAAILEAALFDPQKPWSLKPRKPSGWIDDEYIFYAVGLLSQEFPDEALRIAKKYIKPLDIQLPVFPKEKTGEGASS